MRRAEAGKLPLIRYRLIKEATGTTALQENAATPLAGLQLTESAATAVAPPQIEGRALTEFVDRPDRVLASLVDWRAAQSADASTGDDPNRVRMFESRASRALATASGVSFKLGARADGLVPGVPAMFSIELANSGMREVHVDRLRLESWGSNANIPTADLLLPDTETVVSVDTTTPKNAALTVPPDEHLYDGSFLGKQFVATADLEIDGAKFSMTAKLAREIAPPVEIRKISPPLLVWTPGRRDQVLTFEALVKNNLATPFRGVLALNSKALGISAVGTALSLQANESRSVELRSSAAVPAISRLRSTTKRNAFLIVEDSAATAISKASVPVVFSALASLRVCASVMFPALTKRSSTRSQRWV